MLRNAGRLTNLIRQANVALIHARSRAPAWSALVAAGRAHIPFVTTYHGIYNASNPLKRFYNSVMVKSDAVIANSRWTADHIKREHNIFPQRITVIHRGVDLEEFDPAGVSPDRVAALRAQWNARSGDMLILLPGRLTRWKGQLVFIAALAQLARQGAFGLASDLRTEPASFGTADELVALAKALNQFGGTFFIHPHDAIFLQNGDILVTEWVPIGRITLLRKVG